MDESGSEGTWLYPRAHGRDYELPGNLTSAAKLYPG